MKKCTIVILDEVNCKITDLELRERKALVKMFEYEKPGARYLPSVRLGRWNGKTSYFSLGGQTYVNLLTEIIPLLDQAGYEIELDDRRKHDTSFNFDLVNIDSFKDKVWPKKHPQEGQPIQLRDYQVDIINTLLANTQSMTVAATGSGKTIVTAALSYSVEKYGRTIVIVPNQSLVTQTEQDYINLGLDVGVFFGNRKEYNKQHTICTWQSLHSLKKQSKEKELEISIYDFIRDVVCVIVDEAHGIKAEGLKTLLINEMANIPIRWAITGTLPKDEFSKKALEISIGPSIGKIDAKDLQDKGVLSNCNINVFQLQDKVEYKDYQSELKFLTTNLDRLKYISKLVIDFPNNTLILIDRLEAGTILEELLSDLANTKQHKPEIVFLSGSTKLNERKEEYESVTSTSNKIIIATYGIAAVGINIVNLHNVVLIEPGKSFIRTIQSIGRGLRKGNDKDHVEIYDITSSCKFSKRHLSARKQYYNEARYPHTTKKLEYK
jgi:superfamily II DNA or RNA helicase